MKTPNERQCRAAHPGAPGTWCWQHTTARHLIQSRKAGASKTSKAVVLSVYDALTEKSTVESSSGFVAFQHELATMAGCSVAVLKLALGQLVSAHLVRVETSPSHGPNTYCLLAPQNHESVSHDVANHDSHNTAIGHRKPKGVPPAATPSGSSSDLETKRTGTTGTPPRVRAPDPVLPAQTVAPPAPSQALEDFRLMLAKGTFRTPNGRMVAQRLIVGMTAGDLAMLTPEEEAKAKALRGAW